MADATLVRAMGGALAVIAGFLERADIAKSEEIGRMLGMYATLTAEQDREQGDILGAWAGMLGALGDEGAAPN